MINETANQITKEIVIAAINNGNILKFSSALAEENESVSTENIARICKAYSEILKTVTKKND